MAINIAVQHDAFHFHVADVEATADADVNAVVPHTLGAVPRDVAIVPLTAACYTSQWRVTAIDAVNVTLTKGNAVGSGAAGAQVRVIARLPQMAPTAP